MCLCVFVYVYVYVCVCMCGWNHLLLVIQLYWFLFSSWNKTATQIFVSSLYSGYNNFLFINQKTYNDQEVGKQGQEKQTCIHLNNSNNNRNESGE